MSLLVYGISYVAIIVFIVGVLYRIISYLKKPMHVRWELYPVPHEGKRASYGGSYLEEVNWWKKPREMSKLGEIIHSLPVMIPEIVFLKGVWENNRTMWFLTFPFHFGLYLLCCFVGLLVVGAIAQLAGVTAGSLSSFGSAIAVLTNLFGPIGFILCACGATGLFFRRLTDAGLRNYSSFEHFFNLALFIITMLAALITWRLVDPSFTMALTFTANLLSFNLAPIHNQLFLAQVVLALLLIAYIPLTHMSHFFMKYFLYHDIRWGDEPNVNNPATQAKIGVALNYPVTWAASHIAGHGKTTWAEVATFNPAAEPEEGKE